ncbi:SOSS complex subunit B1 [Rhinatrema bivittatum]|uniref:SOSS complex subunit B1 n=1 Tax=Rhinatrema bivittatum TaxID=194408 RepID=UPI0011260D3E|nr:SOSS complex subunit B1 [Rhinatrema bivittatum]
MKNKRGGRRTPVTRPLPPAVRQTTSTKSAARPSPTPEGAERAGEGAGSLKPPCPQLISGWLSESMMTTETFVKDVKPGLKNLNAE